MGRFGIDDESDEERILHQDSEDCSMFFSGSDAREDLQRKIRQLKDDGFDISEMTSEKIRELTSDS